MRAICKGTTDFNYLIETENYRIFELPKNIYKDYSIKEGIVLFGTIQNDKIRNREYFEPFHPVYAINDILEFPVIDFITIDYKDYVIVRDCFENTIRVHAIKWQTADSFTKDSKLKCQVFGLKSGKPLLRNLDFKHPIYEVGKEYEFDFMGFDTKYLPDGRPLDILKLKGVDGCIHETPPLPSQSGHKFKPKTIRCKVIDITSYLKLEQTSFKDPYFAKIDDIVNLDSPSIQKYFFNLKKDEKYRDLFLQYEATNSLWTITYCNKALPEIILDLAHNLNFKEAIKLVQILIDIEKWILKSGLIDSFKKEDTKEQIKTKSERLIEKYAIIKTVFGFIINNELKISEIKEYHKKALALSYYLRFNKFELIDYNRLFEYLTDIIKQNFKESINKFELNSLINHIEYQKNLLKKDEIESDFAIGDFNKKPFNSHHELNLYLKYTLVQSYLNDSNTKRNIYLGEFYKYLTFHFSSDFDKKNSLKLAYQIITSQTCCLDLDIEYLNNLDDLDFISKSLSSSISEKKQQVDKDKWVEIINKYKTNDVISVRLKQRTLFGYTGYFDNIYCILPKSYINSNTLKSYNEFQCDITVNAIIQDTYYNFGTIIVKELPQNHEHHRIENAFAKEIEVGDIINGRVKNITNYGVFLSTFAGEGLLHYRNITDLYIDSTLKSFFRIGEELCVCILGKGENNKLEFGLKQLRGTEFEDDLDEIEFRIYSPILPIESSGTNTTKEINAVLIKQLYIQGHIFEYFSNLQYDFEGKIKYLKLSKVYYSAILSSRSYFLNTYISYFDILKSIETTLENKSFESLATIVKNANSLLVQLERNTRTIEKYPSIFRLLFFLDVVQDFNNTTNDSIRKLSGYLLDEKYADYPILNKVAKVVLSNNLIISEKYDVDYIFKNLRILFQYLKDGVFDISENEIEKKERELKERIAHIRNKIFNEESEKVEFKSSLIKPILDNIRSKKLAELLKKDDSKSKSGVDNLIGRQAKNRVIHSAMKTLVAFANSKGGTLFIGINDEGEFIGLCNDYEEIGQSSRDELGKRLDDFINNYIGNSFFGLVSIEFESIDKKDILIIDVKASEDEVFLIKNEKAEDSSDFYIRRHSSSVCLSGKELLEYYKWRFKKNNPANTEL